MTNSRQASPFDRIWGIGYAASNAGQHREQWGQNLLGQALMKVRARLRQDERKDHDKGCK